MTIVGATLVLLWLTAIGLATAPFAWELLVRRARRTDPALVITLRNAALRGWPAPDFPNPSIERISS